MAVSGTAYFQQELSANHSNFNNQDYLRRRYRWNVPSTFSAKTTVCGTLSSSTTAASWLSKVVIAAILILAVSQDALSEKGLGLGKLV
jgi:hypothetical protein